MRYHRIFLLLVLALSCSQQATAQVFDRDQFQARGLSVYQEIRETLGIPGQALLAETAFLSGQQGGGAGGRAFVWPLSAQFRVQNRLAEIDPLAYDTELRVFADQLHDSYWKRLGGGYECCAPGGERFYDDNAHLAVALAEAHKITGEPIYLTRAIDTLEFVLSGEDDVGGGGIYWSEWDHSFKDSAATLQGARAALMIYQATGEQHLLDDALRLYDWAARTTQQPDRLFMEKLYLTGPRAGQVGDYTLVNFAGFALAANTLFYDPCEHKNSFLSTPAGNLYQANQIGTHECHWAALSIAHLFPSEDACRT